MSSCTCFADAPSECIGFLDAPVLSFEEIVYFCTLDRDFKEMIFRASRENGLLECMLSFSNLLFFTQYCGARELPEARAKWTIAAIFLRMLHGESLQPSLVVCVKFCKLLSDDMWPWYEPGGGREWAVNSSSEAAADDYAATCIISCFLCSVSSFISR